MRRKLAAGNWKMNGTSADLDRLTTLAGSHGNAACDVLICPPATLLSRAADVLKGSGIVLGGQDCHKATSGAHTGEISAEMLLDAGASYVILGHSEWRQEHTNTSRTVRAKARTAIEAGLTAIICVGETLEERESQNTLDIIGAQLAVSVPDVAGNANLVIAYEPVWAIGTGMIPTVEQIGEVHEFARAKLEQRFGAEVARSARLLYGGSVNPGNAADIFAVPHVDGALVGGASLKPEDFGPIIDALEASAD